MRTLPSRMYRRILRRDLLTFVHRAFLELNPQARFEPSPYLEVLAAKLVDVYYGRCKRLIINIPPRHLKSHMVSIAFVAWVLGLDPAKQILAISDLVRNALDQLYGKGGEKGSRRARQARKSWQHAG